jgi:putative transcriptional regulator
MEKVVVHNTVQSYRQKVGLTQEALARAVGTTRQTLSAIERGHYTPSGALALQIADIFHVDVRDVFSINKKH